MNDEQTQRFIEEYRDALGRQRDISLQTLDNTRRNQFQNIMGAANAAGMMYSNFPERSKIQYDATTYMPARSNIQTSYQTGLDKLRSNTVNMLNTIADYNDEIASLNKQSQSSNATSRGVKLNNAGDRVVFSLVEGSQFENASGDKIKLGTALKRAGISSNDDIIRSAEQVLSEDEAKRLKNIIDLQKNNTGYQNFIYNVGENYFEPNYSFLSDEDNAFLGRLGLGLGS